MSVILGDMVNHSCVTLIKGHRKLNESRGEGRAREVRLLQQTHWHMRWRTGT